MNCESNVTMETNRGFISFLHEYANLLQVQSASSTKQNYFASRKIIKYMENIASFRIPVTVNDLVTSEFPEMICNMLKEYISTGKINIIEEEKKKPVHQLMKVYGIGAVKAYDLIKQGITTIEQLHTHPYYDILNPTQRIGLNYVDSIQRRIPRDEVSLYETRIQTILNKMSSSDDDVTFTIVGSYRRGAISSGDIDIIFTNKTGQSMMQSFVELAKEDGLIVEVLSCGDIKSLVIANINPDDPKCDYRRVDFMYSTPHEHGFALLYFTGSMLFNMAMRTRALELGYTLNEHRLKEKKTNHIPTSLHTEQDIFKFLQMQYREPHERIDSTSIQLIEEPIEIYQIPGQIENPKQLCEQYIQQGITWLNTQSIKNVENMLIYSNNQYAHGSSPLSDTMFDSLSLYLETVDPYNPFLQKVGSEVERNKVTLEFYLGSMDKIKPESKALDNWMKKYSPTTGLSNGGGYIISAKLDGISAIYSSIDEIPYLHTRGNGTVGQDISYLLPYLRLPIVKGIVRGELIISKKNFELYKQDFANARNMTAGIVNSTKMDNEKYKLLDFVAYEIIKPSLEPHAQMMYLNNWLLLDLQSNIHTNMRLVKYVYQSIITNTYLSNTLSKWKTEYEYDIDGIIITHNKSYPRGKTNPKHSFAFKMMMDEDIIETTVIDVLWEPSKDGYLKPRLRFDPIKLNGSVVMHATAFNGNYIYENNIGIGTRVKVGLSGQVIPYIYEVTQSTQAKMPTDYEYTWNDKHVDIIIVDANSNIIVRTKNISRFFEQLEVDGLKSGTVNQLVRAGYDSVPKILKMTQEELMNVDGFAKKKSEKIHTSIKDKLNTMTCLDLMHASNTFGRGMGSKKMKAILDQIPDILTNKTRSIEEQLTLIAAIKGMSIKSSHLFVDYIPAFIEFITLAGLEYKITQHETTVSTQDPQHPLYKKQIIFSGYRDKSFMKKLVDIGVDLSGSVTKNTFAVIVQPGIIENIMMNPTTKMTQATAYDVPIIQADQFMTTYNL